MLGAGVEEVPEAFVDGVGGAVEVETAGCVVVVVGAIVVVEAGAMVVDGVDDVTLVDLCTWRAAPAALFDGGVFVDEVAR